MQTILTIATIAVLLFITVINTFGDVLNKILPKEHEYIPHSCNKTLYFDGIRRITHTAMPDGTIQKYLNAS